MKRALLKFAVAAVFAISVAIACVSATALANGNADYFGGDSQRHWDFDSIAVYGVIEDFFGEETLDLVPGSKRTLTVQLRNYASGRATFRMRAWPAEGDDASALESLSRFSSKRAYDPLLDEVLIRAYYAGGSIYEGPLRGGGSGLYGQSGIELGSLDPGMSGEIKIELEVPLSLEIKIGGGGFANSLCAVRWQFMATEEDPVEEPHIVSPAPTPAPSAPPPTASPSPPWSPTSAPASEQPKIPTDAPAPEPPGNPEDVPAPEQPRIPADAPRRDLGEEPAPENNPDEEPKPTDKVIVAYPGEKIPQTGRLATFAAPMATVLAALILLLLATFIKSRKKEIKKTDKG
ncbi:MAG: hypothetical protein LBU32_00360 [Clostridiales bacterium]|jgi:hypothetical protein|nr:hypothetical protein [Clostridiales bacterium]